MLGRVVVDLLRQAALLCLHAYVSPRHKEIVGVEFEAFHRSYPLRLLQALGLLRLLIK
jgi:hypothetical protein